MTLQIVDPHIHLWAPGTLRYPWMESEAVGFNGDTAAIKKPYLPADLLADAGDAVQVLKVVHIEAIPEDQLGETQWVQSLANDPANIPLAIVAAADLSQPDVEHLLAAHAEYRNVRGIRQILNVHENPFYDYVGRHYMNEVQWRRNFKLLAKYKLSFDMQLYPSQMPAAAVLARDNPDTTFVINHAGMFVDRNSVDGWRQWHEGLMALAALPNVSVKISGLGMFDHQWTVESLRPYVLTVIEIFGAEHCMFASNFPVDKLYSSYPAIWQAFAQIVADASNEEKAQLFRLNAERVYRI
ncbi:amidohydrolase family protein [Silvimonas soli]|uniref:amidohydrolase family protein n=1 Tax=Silvimonas soli TaxID=2980100 RepID=UPI0024B33EDD|nr:amidohydrolase family protein [Silvimonas soli]